MNLKKSFLPYLAALAILLVPSCLKDQVSYFDQSAAERLQAVQKKTRETLAKPRYGWRMEYFIGNVDFDFGGKNLTLEFGAELDTVRVRTEEYKDSSFTSYYRFTNDDGPVLSFDSFSPILHKYAIPSSEYYESRGGDFEFLIISCKDEEVILKGKRSGKMCKLYPLEEPADQYINRLFDMNKSFHVSSFKGTCGSTAVRGTIDVLNKQFTIQEDIDEYSSIEPVTETAPYILTDHGLKFYEPITFQETVIDQISFQPADTSFSAGSDLRLKGYIPKDWLPYEFFTGRYMFEHEEGLFEIELTPDEEEQVYIVEGMSPKFNMYFGYDIVAGRLTMEAQFVAKIGSMEAYKERDGYVIFVPLSTNGYILGEDQSGFAAVWNRDEANPRYKWQDRGLTPKFITESFLLRLYDLSEGFVRDANGYSMGPQTVAFTASNGNESVQITPKAMYKLND